MKDAAVLLQLSRDQYMGDVSVSDCRIVILTIIDQISFSRYCKETKERQRLYLVVVRMTLYSALYVQQIGFNRVLIIACTTTASQECHSMNSQFYSVLVLSFFL